jgi:TPR repeat protein
VKISFGSSPALLCFALTAGCSPGAVGDVVRPNPESAAEALSMQGLECTEVSRRASPLVVDLQSTERVALDVAMKQGVAVVKYSCAGLEVLSACKIEGGYSFAGVTAKEDVVHLSGGAELAANLPVSGGKLSGELSSSSEVDIAMILIGRRSATQSAALPTDLRGDCAGATHFVRAATVGAFAMAQGSKGRVAAGVELFGVGASGESSQEKRVARKDGDPAACRAARPSAPTPPEPCQSALALELVAFDAAPAVTEKTAAAAVTPPPNPCPIGFVWSADRCTKNAGTEAYQCAPDDEAECATQCAKGDGRSCVHLGHIAARSTAADRAARLLEAYTKGCNLGYGDACAAAGDATALASSAERSKLFTKACELGSGQGCWLASRELLGAGGASDEAILAPLERGCALGFPMACYDYGFAFLAGQGVKQDIPRGIELYSRPCQNHVLEACADVGRLFDTGFPEGVLDPSGPPMVPIDKVRAATQYAMACDGGWEPACADAARLLLLDKTADEKRARQYFERGCAARANYGEACVGLGGMLRDARGAAKDVKRAAELFEKACTYQVMHCRPYADALATGAGVPKDKKRAAELYEKACRYDNSACVLGAEIVRGKEIERARAMLEIACGETRDHAAFPAACALLKKLPAKK